MKRIILSALLSAFSFYSFSQDSLKVQDVRDTRKSLTISFCPTELFYNYHTIFLDYRMKKWVALGVNIGHIKQDESWIGGGLGLTPIKSNPDLHPTTEYNGTVIKLYAKFFLAKESNGFFLEPLLVYKDLSYSWLNLEYHYGGNGPQYFAFTRSETAKQFGGNVEVGWKANYFRKKCYFEIYWGLGFYKRFRDYTTYSWYDHAAQVSDPEKIGHLKEEQDHLTMPLGFKLGFTIYGKK